LNILAFERRPGSTWSGVTPGEDVAQDLLAADVGEDAQFDLRVVGAHELVAGLGDEALADLAAELGADGDVLQVRVGRRQAAGRRRRLVERRVQAAGPVRDQLGQRVEVGRLQLRVLAPLLDLRDDRVLGADGLEDPRVGREAGLAAALLRQAELVEQDLRKLLRRADRELLAGQVMDLALELCDPRLDLVGDLRQPVRVELQAVALHLDEDVNERQLDLLEQPRQPLLLEPFALPFGDHARDDRALGEFVASLDVRGQSLLLRELLEGVSAPRRVDEVRRDHRVVLERRGGRGVLGARDRLPVVRDERPVSPGERERGQRLGLADQHLVAAVRGELERRRPQPAV
jgi:hypothetical protein